MDFSNRSSQPQTVAPNTHTAAPASPGLNGRKNSAKDDKSKLFRLSIGALVAYLVAVVILIAAVLLVLGINKPKAEGSFVDTSKLQAVFLNTGQVYFGNIKSLNNNYFVLDNIYYLQTSGGSSTSASAANTSVSLVKLGCELHSPYDQMLINRTQVTFWENLQDSGQVAKAVKTFEQQNPNGQKCAQQTSASSTGASSSVQSANNGSTGSSTPTTTSTTPSTTTTKP